VLPVRQRVVGESAMDELAGELGIPFDIEKR